MKTRLSHALLLFFVVTSFNVLSQAPKTLSYQGRLSDSGGPLNGTYTLTFTIYDADNGGTTLWTETNSGVSATNGNISLTLGKSTPINVGTDKPLWMGIKVGSNAEISPRIELTGSLYSLGLALPYSAKTAAPGNVFLIEATQDGARAGEFIHSGSGGGQAALFATSTGGNRAFQALNSGPAASSALFYMQNSSSFSPNVEMHSQALGQGLQINMLNNNNASDAINITHSGSGYAINANRPIKAPTIVIDSMTTTGSIHAARFFGNGSGLTNLPSSLSLPYTGTSSSPSAAFSVTSTSTSGGVGNFTISNSASGATGLTISNQGSGPGLNSFQFGSSGSPGIFQTNNITNASPTLRLAQNGIGSGILLTTTNPLNSAPVINVSGTGTGSVLNLSSTNGANTASIINITSSGTGNAITANKPIQATRFIGDGSGLTNLPGFALPFSGTNPGNTSFSITNTNNSYGSAANFSNTDPANNGPVLAVSTGSAGFGGYFSTTNPNNQSYAVFGENLGKGVGGGFRIHNAANTFSALSAYTDGLGGAADFQVLNPSNTASAITITNLGTGNAISANGPIQATKFIGDGSLLTNLPSGLTLPYTSTVSTGTAAFSITSTNAGVGGAASFTTNNAANSGATLAATSNGQGNAFQAINNGIGGGIAGYFQTTDPSGASPTILAEGSGSNHVLKVRGNGTSPAASLFAGPSSTLPALDLTNLGTGITTNILVDNTSNSGDGIRLTHKGLGHATVFQITNTSNGGNAISASTNGSGNAIIATTSGTGSAGYIRILNASNPNSALISTTTGTGDAITVAQNGSSGNVAVFQSNSANVARIDKTGKGFFNGGTQTGGADVAEMFDVEGASSQYEPGDVLVISEKTDRTVEKSTEANSTRIAGVYATKPGVILTERDIEQNLDDLVPMGVVGVIPTKVCDENGSIQRGDLLVTSAVTGHAMKAIPVEINGVKIYPTGAILGKALENFDGNRGLIKVLVNVK